MSKSTRTPGKWKVYKFGQLQIGNVNGEAVCSMWGDEESPMDSIHANARLIAAAPDLLDIAITLCNQFDASGIEAVENSHDPGEMLHFKARAAIAKAEAE